MTRREVYNFITHFDKLKLPKDNKNFTMKFALGVNKSKLEPVYRVIMEQLTKVPKYQEYSEKHNALIRQYLNTKPKDNEEQVKQDLKTGETSVNIDDNKVEEFNSKIKELNDEYSETLEEVRKVDKEFQEFLNGEIEESVLPKVAKVDQSDLPSDVYTDEDQFYLISFMVNY